MKYAGIALYGDSIGRGIDFDSGRGRYAVLRTNFSKILKERGIADIDNRSRFGATVTDGLKDYESSVEGGHPYVMLAFGGNDCNMPWELVAREPDRLHDAATPLPLFEATLRRFGERIARGGKTPLLLTPPPLIAERFAAWVSQGLDGAAIQRYLGDVQHVYRWHERYANAVRRVGKSLNCAVLDLRDRLLSEERYPSLVGIDGMHINIEGHQAIAGHMEALLAEALG